MRIYTRQAFLALPPGTVFSKGKPWAFHGFMVKGKTWTYGVGDFYYQDLAWIDSQGDTDQYDKFTAMLEQGASVPLNTMEQRDGCFDEDEIFLVYEPGDLRAVITAMVQALTL
jgi:hypothetical protein